MVEVTKEFLGLAAGACSCWDLAGLDSSQSPQEQVDHLKEDLAQVRLSDSLLLDVGWYPEFDVDGHFGVVVVRNADWDEPVFSGNATTWAGLCDVIREAIAAVQEHQR